MKVVSGGPASANIAASGASGVTKAAAPSASARSSAASNEALQSAALQPALKALDALPEIDQAKVAAIRDALAKGELPFDAGKLAALIESYHRAGQ